MKGWIIFSEIIGCMFALIYGLSCLGNTSYYYVHNPNDQTLGYVYVIGALIIAIIVYNHTQSFDDGYYNNNYRRTYHNTCGYWGDGLDEYYDTPSTTYNKVHHKNVSTYVPPKTTTDIINDISKSYPQTTTIIGEVTKHEVKKKSFFSFKKEEITITTTIVPQKTESNKDILSNLIKVISNYICYEHIGFIRKSIVSVERNSKNEIDIFYKPSNSINVHDELSKGYIAKSLPQYIKPFEKINLIEVAENNLEKVYSENHARN